MTLEEIICNETSHHNMTPDLTQFLRYLSKKTLRTNHYRFYRKNGHQHLAMWGLFIGSNGGNDSSNRQGTK